MKTFNQAQDYFNDALILSNRINTKDSTHFAEIWLELGKVALENGDLQQAIIDLNKALKIYQSSANPNEVAIKVTGKSLLFVTYIVLKDMEFPTLLRITNTGIRGSTWWQTR